MTEDGGTLFEQDRRRNEIASALRPWSWGAGQDGRHLVIPWGHTRRYARLQVPSMPRRVF